MKNYIPVIGLEIHAELKTKSKMFCGSKNDPDETRPNVNVCPVCMAHPGTLPTLNKQAIEHMVRIGLAVGGDVANFTEFDRKNYFYPDIPKSYQISQYKHPIVENGSLAGVSLTRIHLEEDTGENKHEGRESYVNFNRAGVPLMELVTDPVIHSAEDAMKFAKELQLLLRYLGVAEANMQKGEMRIEPNISIIEADSVDELRELWNTDRDAYFARLGTKVEVKNINSFSYVGKAIETEVARMIDLVEAGRGDEIVQETRGWDEQKNTTFSQRLKENSDDYRYFPDPDLPKLYLDEIFDKEALRKELPELPAQKRERYVAEYGIKLEDVESFVVDKSLGEYFENVAELFKGDSKAIALAANYLTSDMVGNMAKDDSLARPSVDDFVALIKMNIESTLNSRGTKDVLLLLMQGGTDPAKIAEENGFVQKNDPDELRKIAQGVIDENQKAADEYRAGKEASIKFLMGQVMKASRGSANPKMAEDMLRELLS